MPAVRSIVSGSHRETEIESICYEVDEFGLPWRSYGWFEILGRHLACVRNIVNEGRVFDLCLCSSRRFLLSLIESMLENLVLKIWEEGTLDLYFLGRSMLSQKKKCRIRDNEIVYRGLLVLVVEKN